MFGSTTPSFPPATTDEDVQNSESFSIKDLSTRSVTVYPLSATVVRDIPNITVKPGRNVYSIIDISAAADESSFKIEGHGTTASITDMTVELIGAHRPKSLFGSWPSFGPQHQPDDSSSEDESTDEEELETPEDDPAVKAISHKLQNVQWEKEAIAWNFQSVNNEISAWESFGRNACMYGGDVGEYQPPVERMKEFVMSYTAVRDEAKQKQLQWSRELAELDERAIALNREREKLLKPLMKAYKKACRSRRKRSAEKAQKKIAERQTGDSHGQSMPYYRVRVTVEQESLPEDTKTIVSSVDTGKPKQSKDNEAPVSEGPSLRISYVVRDVNWMPKYEIRLDTVEMTAVMTYRAEMKNCSGEQWKNAAVTLSTSSSTFSGLGQKMPSLGAWRLKLNKDSSMPEDRGLYTSQELPEKPQVLKPSQGLFGQSLQSNVQAQPPRGLGCANNLQTSSVFGVNAGSPKPSPFGKGTPFGFQQHPQPLSDSSQSQKTSASGTSNPFGAPNANSPFEKGTAPHSENVSNTSGGLFGKPVASNTTGAFGTAQPTPNTAPTTSLFGKPTVSNVTASGLFGSTAQATANTSASLFGSSNTATNSNTFTSPSGGGNSASVPAVQGAMMGVALTSLETYGVTATFALPGLRTIPSSTTSRRYTITEVALEDIKFSYSSVPVLRPVVYVTASGSLPLSAPGIAGGGRSPLFGGPSAGITVDGSYLGQLSVPRTAPGDRLTLDLGVEEGITINYKPPTKKTLTDGRFVRDTVSVFSRCFEVVNKRPKPATVVVKDHVPISKDNVSIKILKPKELEKEGDEVLFEKEDTSVKLGEDGAVEWTLNVAEHGGKRKGELEWEVRVPLGDAWEEAV